MARRRPPADRSVAIAVAALCLVVAAVFVGALLIRDFIDDYGFTDAQLERVERICTERAEDRAGGDADRYDEVFERCETIERAAINPDPYPPN